MSNDRLLSANEAAAFLGLTSSHVRLLIRNGEIPAYNVSARQGRATYRVSEAELRRWVAKRKAVGHCTDGKVKAWRGANA